MTDRRLESLCSVAMLAREAASANIEKLDIERKLRVWRNATGAFVAVGEFRRNRYTTLATNGHAWDTAVPALDDFATAEGEGEWRALFVGWDKSEHG